VPPLLSPDRARDLPAIFHADPFPLLLPAEYNPRRACEHPVHGVVALTEDRRLMQWKAADRGGRQVTLGQLHGHLDWISVEDDGMVCLMLRHGRKCRLVTVRLIDGDRSTAELGVSNEPLRHVMQSGGVMVVLRSGTATAYDRRTGNHIGTERVTGTQPGSRYVLNDNWLSAASWDGARFRFERLRIPTLPPRDAILTAFDREGFDGPFLITRQGRIISCTTGEPVSLSDRIGEVHWVQQISRDGDQLLLGRRRLSSGGLWQAETVLVELSAGRVSRATRKKLDFAYSSLLRFRSQLTPRYWHAVAIDPSGTPILLGKGDCCWRVALSDRSHILQLSAAKADGLRFARFQAMPAGQWLARGVKLRIAELPGGSRVYSDSRGLLHFKSGDLALPEVTLATFNEQPPAGWSSDGEICGQPFFLPDEGRSAPHSVMANLLRFSRRAQ